MSVDLPKIIDVISTDTKGRVILTISDHLEWDEKLEHLLILQNKINDYLAFIESGQIYIDYPSAHGKPIIIDIMAKYLPDETANKFLRIVREKIQEAGYDIKISSIPGQ